MLALAVMTCISVAIGHGFKSLPDVLKSSLPVGQYAGAAFMLYFGLKTLKVRAGRGVVTEFLYFDFLE